MDDVSNQNHTPHLQLDRRKNDARQEQSPVPLHEQQRHEHQVERPDDLRVDREHLDEGRVHNRAGAARRFPGREGLGDGVAGEEKACGEERLRAQHEATHRFPV